MSRKIILFFILVATFSPRFFAFANLQINEIMYDLKTGSDDGREWVEIYNDNNTPVDLSSFRFFEADTNHKIKLIQGDANIPAQGYALIVSNPVKFKTDWFTPPELGGANFSGTIFDSSFSLNNDGEVLMLKDKNLNIIDQYVYKSSLGGAGDGNSLQKIGGVWQGAPPTPGTENKPENKVSVAPIVASPLVKSEPIVKKVSIKPKNLIQEITTPTPVGVTPPPSDFAKATPDKQEGDNNYFSIITLTLLLGISAGTVYFIRRKKSVTKAGDDFDILDE